MKNIILLFINILFTLIAILLSLSTAIDRNTYLNIGYIEFIFLFFAHISYRNINFKNKIFKHFMLIINILCFMHVILTFIGHFND